MTFLPCTTARLSPLKGRFPRLMVVKLLLFLDHLVRGGDRPNRGPVSILLSLNLIKVLWLISTVSSVCRQPLPYLAESALSITLFPTLTCGPNFSPKIRENQPVASETYSNAITAMKTCALAQLMHRRGNQGGLREQGLIKILVGNFTLNNHHHNHKSLGGPGRQNPLYGASLSVQFVSSLGLYLPLRLGNTFFMGCELVSIISVSSLTMVLG